MHAQSKHPNAVRNSERHTHPRTHHHTHHGTTNAVCMPAVLEFNRPAIEERFNKVSGYLGIKGGFNGFCEFVDDFNERLGIPKSLSELGVLDPDFKRLTAGALNDPSCGGNPITLNAENIYSLLKKII